MSLGFQFSNCRGQRYDGESNFQLNISASIPVHCLVHCADLCLQEIARKVSSIKEGLNFAMEVIQLIKLYPK